MFGHKSGDQNSSGDIFGSTTIETTDKDMNTIISGQDFKNNVLLKTWGEEELQELKTPAEYKYRKVK